MKKIILLFFTFLGICSCFSQAISTDMVAVLPKPFTNILPFKMDSIKTKAKPLVRLYPNPAKNKIEIDVTEFEPGYIKLQLVNITGKIMREEKRLMLTGNETIVFMFSEAPGLYYLILKQGSKLLKNKLVIQ